MSAKKEDAKAPAGAAPAADAGAKKGLPIKTIGVVGVIMILEAAMVGGAVMMFGPKKTVANVQEHAVTEDPGAEIAEIPIADEKYQNLQQGKVWFWDISIVVQVKEKNVEAVENRLKQRNAEISEGLGQIVSRAQPQHLKEPDRQTLNRQFSAYLAKLFGNDAEGNALIERVLIPRCRGMPGEF